MAATRPERSEADRSAAPYAVGVQGTGNMGRAAVRAVAAHPELRLAAVASTSPANQGRDAGELVDLGSLGVAVGGPDVLAGCDAVVYAASGDVRPQAAAEDVAALLGSGSSVVSSSLYGLYDVVGADAGLRERMEGACRRGASRLFVSGIDPGWGNDVLPLLATGLCHSIREVRCQEIFDYSTYDQPYAVRELVGLGSPMDVVPPMVAPGVPTMVWGGQLHMMARALGLELDRIEETLDRRALPHVVATSMGEFAAGTTGALRFEVIGVVDEVARLTIEHVSRIHPDVAPEWPQPTSGAGSHRVVVVGEPRLEITVEAEAEGTNRAAGGNATAAVRLVGAIPWLLAAPVGLYDATSVPVLPGRGRFVTAGPPDGATDRANDR